MTDNEKLIETVNDSNRWMIFGGVSPILFTLLFGILFYSNILKADQIIYVAIAFAVVVCFVWWFWVLKVIVALSQLNLKANKDLTEMRDDVKIIAHEVRESARDLFVLLDAVQKKQK